jgi:hypothetical protein
MLLGGQLEEMFQLQVEVAGLQEQALGGQDQME